MKTATAEQMRALDAAAINTYGIPGIVLMENAGCGTVRAMVRKFGNPAGWQIAIFVGPGNNGGDGLVIARHLHQLGARPEIFMLVSPEKLSGDPAINLNIVKHLPIPLHVVLSERALASHKQHIEKSRILVDSLFGTGLVREVAGHFAEAVRLMNSVSCPVVAVDIPSGLHTDTGEVLGVCVQADLTATFGLAKPALVTGPGLDFTGHLEIIDIGIPPQLVNEANLDQEPPRSHPGGFLQGRKISRWLPGRPAAAHKGTYGHLLVIAGSTGKTGAAILCARGALRCGTGLVTLCVPRDLNAIYEAALPEAMTIPMPSAAGVFSLDDYPNIVEAMIGKKAVVLGPGLGTAEESVELVRRLYRDCTLPMVVDADGLNILAGTGINNPAAARVLTPHPGEMSRLTGKSTKGIQADRQQTAESFARANRVYMVLKGAGTVIAGPEQDTVINPTGNPGMAAGGMGDVLAGVIGGFLAQGLSPWQAACLGVYSHGLAGDRLAASMAGFGYLASEVADELPATLEELRGT